MRNYKGAFYRTDEISREPDQCPEWLDLLATKLKVEASIKESPKTAVEVARQRQRSQPSIYEMMSAIVSGQKPKYSSVEEAVKDYQRRTGLEEYLKRASDTDLGALAGEIVRAAEDTKCPKCGAQALCAHCKQPFDSCECDMESAKDKCPECGCPKDDGDALDFFRNNLDYGNARDMTEEELEANPGKKKLITESDEDDDDDGIAEKPQLLQENPAIESYLNNVIETNYGIQMPAILHSLIETFRRDGVDYTIFSDRGLLDWINQRLIEKGQSHHETPSQIGRGVGTHIDYSGEKDPNRDPFTLLVPDKGSM